MAKKRASPRPKSPEPARDSGRRQLFMAKLLCVRGDAAASSGAVVDRVVGVLLLEKAVETALNAIVDKFGGGPGEPTFASLWKAAQGLVAKHIGWELPFKAGVDHIHHLRTGVQHHGLVPSREDGGRAAAAAYEFTREMASQVFNVDVDALALPEIVSDENVAKALSEASALLEKGDNWGSVQTDARAFDQLLSVIEAAEAVRLGAHVPDSDVRSFLHDQGMDLSGMGLTPLQVAMLRTDPLRTHFSPDQSRALRALRRVLVEVATALLLGVELPALRRFRALALRPADQVTREDAVFALNFALDCALRSEPGPS